MSGSFFSRRCSGDPSAKHIGPEQDHSGKNHELESKLALLRCGIDALHTEKDKQDRKKSSKREVNGEDAE